MAGSARATTGTLILWPIALWVALQTPPQATATPSPTPSPTPAAIEDIAVPTPIPLLPLATPTPDRCNVDAAVIVPAIPLFPKSAGGLRTQLSVDLDVSLDEDGKVTGTEVIHSSGRDDIDASAQTAATQTMYAARRVECKPIASTYRLHLVFTPPL